MFVSHLEAVATSPHTVDPQAGAEDRQSGWTVQLFGGGGGRGCGGGRASKSHNWFKSYGDFAEWVNFAYWRSFVGKGLRLQPAQQACFIESRI